MFRITDSAPKYRGLFAEGDPDPTQAGGAGGGDKPKGPSWVPAEEFKQFQQTMLQQFETLGTAVRALTQAGGGSRPAEPAAPAKPRITEEQYEKAVQDGDAKTMAAYVQQQVEDIRTKDIAPLQVQGLDAISNLTREMVLDRLPHYKKFKAEIDQYVERLPPQAKLSPVAYKIAHDAVVGMHHDELVKEATEAAIRKAAQEGGSTTPGEAGAGRQAGGTKKTPTAKEHFGEDAANALSSVGKDEETFARKLGYKSWADYVAMAQKQEQGEGVAG